MPNLIQFLGIILVPIALFFFTQYSQKKPDVVYLLSEQIPYVEGDAKAPTDLGQKLEVKNVGDAEAKRIIVKVDGQIVSSSLKQFLAKDVPESTVTATSAEFVYPSLPPSGSFQVLLRSRSKIGSTNVSVLHESGAAREALSSNLSSNWWWINYLLMTAAAVYVWAALIELRSSNRLSLIWKHRESGPETLWALKKPWYWTAAKWQEIILEIAKKNIQEPKFVSRGKIGDTFAFRTFALSVSSDAKDLDREPLLSKAGDRLIDLFEYELRQAYSTSDVETVMSLKLPASVPQQVSSAIESRAAKRWLENIELPYDATGTLESMASTNVPSFVRQADWITLENKHVGRLMGELRLKLHQYPKNDFSPNERLMRLLPTAERESIERTQTELRKEHDFDGQQRHLDAQRRDLEALGNEVAAARSRVRMDREKVDTQLGLIHSVLTDASAIDRIEEYATTFAKGNFANLKRVANVVHTITDNQNP